MTDSFPMSSKSDKTVAIVGGGPVGALAALYFARYFEKVSLYELRAGAHSIVEIPQVDR